MTFGFYTLLMACENHPYAMKVLDGVRLSPTRKRSATVPRRCMLRQGIHYDLHPIDQPGSTIPQRSRAVDSM
ncbi:hypothetical protein BDV27DRAFT_129193 [Aspergillus caelatus]|uniref:Uncharacterized protein n=1 Tax=Aspergillus caelatus TaxID=61420 RepID=A0A5N7A337_9EURO|nr:uncharacterized protein BDV27DRAFT_129193 [Aspergillus caelatus]KAE8363983.1 hypothetical protein BDV27DRAFT_129193 [Aspergillus caelatus]